MRTEKQLSGVQKLTPFRRVLKKYMHKYISEGSSAVISINLPLIFCLSICPGRYQQNNRAFLKTNLSPTNINVRMLHQKMSSLLHSQLRKLGSLKLRNIRRDKCLAG